MDAPVIEVVSLNKTFGKKLVLKNINFSICAGEMVGLIGASGSGKSTLIRLLAGFETIGNGGQVKLFNRTVQADGKQTAASKTLRRDVGVIFQQFNLVGRLALLTNVLVGRLAHNPYWKGMIRLFLRNEPVKALEALERVNMVDFAHQRTSTLSGGQQQRGAIARAIAQEARLVLADEPIASLDPASSDRVMNLLSDINKKDDVTILVSLHQFEVATTRYDRIIALKNDEIIFDGKASAISEKELMEVYSVDNDNCRLGAQRPATIRQAS